MDTLSVLWQDIQQTIIILYGPALIGTLVFILVGAFLSVIGVVFMSVVDAIS